MKTVISVDLMRRSDAHTIETKTPSKELMYRAGKAVFESCDFGENTAIVCGSGNNAGDGYVIALCMKEAGLKCKLILTSDKFSPDGLYYFEKCQKAGIPYEYADENTSFAEYTHIADCIFGTGFKGSPRGITADIIDKINSSGKRVISVDINSGLNGDSGKYEKCVHSDVTASIGYLKTGFFLSNAKKVIGNIVNLDIGIDLIEEGYTLIEKDDPIPDYESTVSYPEGDNPIEELMAYAKSTGKTVKSCNIITNGKECYIIEEK